MEEQIAMKCGTWHKIVLGMLMAAVMWCSPALPAWGMPELPAQMLDIDDYNGPALAEVQELQRFMIPVANDALSVSLDMFALMVSANPDPVIQYLENMKTTLGANPSISAAVKNKLQTVLNKAKAEQQSGSTMDAAAYTQQIKTLMPQYLSQLQQINDKMYNGIKPRLFSIAAKDPDFALQMCDAMERKLSQSQFSGDGTSNASDDKMRTLPTELRKYAMQIKAKQER